MATVHQILDCLNRERVRATYGAVGEVLQLPAQSVGQALGSQTRRASWVVNAKTGEPTGYAVDQKHPDLYRTPRIIRTGAELFHLLGTTEAEADMTNIFRSCNIPPSCRNIAPHTTVEALHETRESRRKQDAKLQTCLRVATTTLVLYIATMAVFTTASGKFASLTAILMFVGSLLLLLTLGYLGYLFFQWNDEPKIGYSRLSELSKHSTPQHTDLYLIDLHLDAYKQNKTTLRNVILGVGFHIVVVFSGGVIALLALLEIVPALTDSPIC